MSKPPDDQLPEGSFSKATVDRWQVFGGMAGVAALGLSVVGAIKDNLVPVALTASGVAVLVGIVLLYRRGRQPREQTMKAFLIPLLVTVLGTATAGFVIGRGLGPASGAVAGREDGGAISSESPLPSSPERARELSFYFKGAKPGEPIETMPTSVLTAELEYKNLSGKHQEHVSLHVELPPEMEIVRGTERFFNSGNANPRLLTAELISPGVDIGGYLPNGNAFVAFSIRVANADRFTCNTRTLAPQVFLTSGGETASAELVVRIKKRC